jgi:hypothetical protein
VAALLLSLMIVLVAGCHAQLAPAYDSSIVDGLTRANEQTMTLFASVSSGTTVASPFTDREKTYNELIGEFDALRLQAEARPAPQPPTFGASGASTAAKAPTAGILTTIIDGLTQMRKRDESGPMPVDVVAIFKQDYELSIKQAFTYEKALQR